MVGGGEYTNGKPPIYIGFKEPLDVRIIEAQVNGNKVEDFIVDGINHHEIVIEVRFSGGPVPDGTPLEVYSTGPNADVIVFSISGRDEPEGGTVYTRQELDSGGILRSYAYITINPLPPEVPFYAQINVVCRYDKLGTVEREITRSVSVLHSISQPEEPPAPGYQAEGTPTRPERAVSDEIIVFNTTNNDYTTVGYLIENRSGHFCAHVETGTESAIPSSAVDIIDAVYSFGGRNESRILTSSEYFDITNSTSNYTSNMPTPRSYGMTVVHNGNIYCIGGIEFDELLSEYRVSRKIERYDPRTETWNATLTSIPGNGVCFGHAYLYDNLIYVICGATEIIENSIPYTMNNIILEYNISADTWSSYTVTDENLYSRIAPFSFVRIQGSSSTLYVYGGSLRKTEAQISAERAARINAALERFKSEILTSAYYLHLTPTEQNDFRAAEETRIQSTIAVSPYSYLATGFKYELPMTIVDDNITINDKLDDEWPNIPVSRDRGRSHYLPIEDKAYFLGGSNQNVSSTYDLVESIDINANNVYEEHPHMPRGLSLFGSDIVSDDIYIVGGFSSGHRPGWVQIHLSTSENRVEALGKQTVGLLVSLTRDSGALIEGNIRAVINARLKIKEIDEALTDFFGTRLADRTIGGDGTGSKLNSTDLTLADLHAAQNSLIDPNSDEFLIDSSRRLSEILYLFPILLTEREVAIVNGTGGTTLLPRAEDPYTELKKFAQFIKSEGATVTTEIGGLTQEELAALGEILSNVVLDPTEIHSGTTRNLYEIELSATLIDQHYFGENINSIEFDIFTAANTALIDRIEQLNKAYYGAEFSNPLLLPHASQPDIPLANRPGNTSNAGGLDLSGQQIFSEYLIPLNADIKAQSDPVILKFFSYTDWVPRVNKKLVGGELSEAMQIVERDRYKIPLGGSQLYNALMTISREAAGERFDDLKKVIYVASDNVQNLTFTTREEVVEEINAIDGENRTPIIYVLFSTAYPNNLSTQTQNVETNEITKLADYTGGQATSLLASQGMDEVLNFAISGTIGSMGYGKCSKLFTFDDTVSINRLKLSFSLPSNTEGKFRFRYSTDDYNFSNWSDWYSNNATVNFIEFLTKSIEVEIILSSGFTIGIAEEYDDNPTGLPWFNSAKWQGSQIRNDFIYVNPETVLTNAQQVAAALEGSLPTNAEVQIGVATSLSTNWNDYQNDTRPAINGEFGKTILLDRTRNDSSIVSLESLSTFDYIIYKTLYGRWNPDSDVQLYQVTNNILVPVTSGFLTLPTEGEIHFATQQDENKEFRISVNNRDTLRLAVRLSNTSPIDPIIISGFGYIYSTNDIKPVQVSQAAPVAEDVTVIPSNPTAADTIQASYTYKDVNGDPEDGTVISWFKNNQQLFEIQGKISWKDDNLLPRNKLEPKDKITFSVTPNDGRLFGETVFAVAVKIASRPPSATGLTILSFRNESVNIRFDTASTLTAQYTFTIEDIGTESIEKETDIKWYVNGQLFKVSTYSQGDDINEKKSITPDFASEISGLRAQQINNTVYVEVTPKTTNITGPTVTSETIIIVNSLPIISNVTITPNSPTTSSDLEILYTIDDPDIALEDQTDQSAIMWEKSTDGTNYAEVVELAGLTTVPSSELTAAELWRVKIIPYDGIDANAAVYSNVVSIQS